MRGWGIVLSACALLSTAASFSAAREDIAENSKITRPTRLWTEPNKYGEAIAALDPGVKIEILDYSTEHDWVQVRTPAGREGWVMVRTIALGGRRTPDILVGQPRSGARPRNPAADGAAQPLDPLLMDGPAIDEPAAQTENLKDAAPVSMDPEQNNSNDPAANVQAASVDGSPRVDSEGAEEVINRRVRREQMESTRKANAAKTPLKDTNGKKSKAKVDLEFSEPVVGNKQLGVSIEYNQILSPEAMPGVAIRPNFVFRMNDHLWLGGGMDWAFNSTSVTSISNAKVTRSQNNFQPNALVRFEMNHFRVDGSIGMDFERASLRSIDLDTGLVILTNAAGELVTGTGWSTGMTLRVAPAYLFNLDNGFQMGFTVNYQMRKEFGSATGIFAGPAVSSLQHSIGGGLALVKEF